MPDSSLSNTQTAKQSHIKSTSFETFRKYGFKRVTVEELCEAASISKATFYKYFPNKIELVKHLLIENYEIGYKWFSELIESNRPLTDKVEEMIDYKLKQVEYWGEAFVTDLLDSEADLGELIQTTLKRFMALFIDFFQKEQASGNIRSDLRPEVILTLTLKIRELIKDPEVRMLFPDNSEMARTMNEFIFYGILGKREQYDEN